jgi:glycosyltransferase involved in cell wall biosynthesis
MGKIYLDVTSILGWMRPAVGIIRVEAECALYGLRLPRSELEFCRLNSHSQFELVSESEVRQALARITAGQETLLTDQVSPQLGKSVITHSGGITSAADSTSAFANTAQDHTTRADLKNEALRVFSYLPRFFREPLIWVLHVVRRHCFSLLWPSLKKEESQKSKAAADMLHATNISLDQIIKFEKEDVYLSMGGDWNHGNLDYLRALKTRIDFRAVLFCYDTIPILFPHLTLEWVAKVFPSYFENMAYCADKILCISESSKEDLNKYLNAIGAPTPSMSVVYLGSEVNLAHEGNLAQSVKQVLSKPFVLFVSTIERRKNHETLYRAYTRLIDKGAVDLPQLIFVGGVGWGVNDFLNDLRLDLRTQKYIKIIDDATDLDLRALYENCLFTLYPSLYEGWGLPVAESLMSGKFCLVANDSSLPEVGGSFVEYVDPWDVQAWANQIAYFVDHPQEVHKREAMIRANYQATSWQHASEQIFAHAQSQLIVAKGEKG